MSEFTEKEKQLLQGAVDLSISQITSELPKVQQEEDRVKLRQLIDEMLIVAKKIARIKTIKNDK